MTVEQGQSSHRMATATLTCALALAGFGQGDTRALATSLIRPVAITNWSAETDGNRLDPALLANLRVAICDDHFPAGSLARTEIEDALALYAGANGVNINITYVNATQYVPHKRKSTLFASPPSATLQIDYVDNAAGATDPFTGAADNGTFPCHPTVGDTACTSWSGNTCRYSSVNGWNAGPVGLKQAAVISINPYCTAQDSAPKRWTTNLADVFNMDGVSHEMGHVVGLLHSGSRPFASDVFQTKMIQALGQLSAYDLGFLTQYYPANMAIGNPDYSASRALRLEQANGTLEGGVGDFAELNPKNLYASSGDYYSCTNAERPVYTAQFFDKSPNISGQDVDVRFVVSTPPGTWIELHRETVPLSTSTSKFTQVDVTSAPLIMGTAAFGLAVAPAASMTATLQFETDPYHASSEITRANNNVAMTLNLYRDRSLCPDSPRPVTADLRTLGDTFGGAVTAAEDRVVSGAQNHGFDAAGANFQLHAGAAWVHKLNAATGVSTLEDKLVPTGVNARRSDDLFGSAVAMTSDIVAVGAPGHDFDATGASLLDDAGAVYLFRRSGTAWTQQAKVTPPIGRRHAGDGFGSSVALSPDGLILAVGAPFHDYDANGLSFAESAGAVFVFRYSGSNWIYFETLAGSSVFGGARVAGDLFGSSLALAPGKLAVGAPGQDYDTVGFNRQEDAGAVYVFSDSGVSFTSPVKLVPLGIGGRFAYDYFGASVAMYRHSNDRYTLVAGAYGQDYDAAGANYASMAGAAYVFTAEAIGTIWTERQKLTGEPGTAHRNVNDYFGKSVGISGTRLIVGADGQDYNVDGGDRLWSAGAVYVYEPVSGIAWSVIKKTGAAGAGTNARQAYDAYGRSVAITGSVFAVGAPSHSYDVSGANYVASAGATFVYFR